MLLFVAVPGHGNGNEELFPEFSLYYGNFKKLEGILESIRSEKGDVEYLKSLYSGRVILMIRDSYDILGAHPEKEAPADTPANATPSKKGLAASRVYAAKYYFHLWAASLLMDRNPTMNHVGSAPTECLVAYFKEDTEIQALARELVVDYVDNSQPVIAGLSGSEIIAHMISHIDSLREEESERREGIDLEKSTNLGKTEGKMVSNRILAIVMVIALVGVVLAWRVFSRSQRDGQ